MGKKEKWIWDRSWGRSQIKIQQKILPYLCGILLQVHSFPNFNPDTQTLRVLEMMFNTKRSTCQVDLKNCYISTSVGH